MTEKFHKKIAEKGEAQHSSLKERLWPFLFTVALVVAMIFGYAWWSLNIIFEQLTTSVFSSSVEMRIMIQERIDR